MSITRPTKDFWSHQTLLDISRLNRCRQMRSSSNKRYLNFNSKKIMTLWKQGCLKGQQARTDKNLKQNSNREQDQCRDLIVSLEALPVSESDYQNPQHPNKRRQSNSHVRVQYLPNKESKIVPQCWILNKTSTNQNRRKFKSIGT